MPLAASDLRGIFNETLERCAPDILTASALSHGAPSAEIDVVALGKCAVSLLRGARCVVPVCRAFAAAPRGYASIGSFGAAEAFLGTHPEMSNESCDAGEHLISFVRASRRPVWVLMSGGSSACIEAPLTPWFSREDLIVINRALVRSDLPIREINIVRKHMSAIKGGRLGAMLPPGSRVFILSDVDRGDPYSVGSGPAVADVSTRFEAAAILRRVSPEVARFASIFEASDFPETPKSLPLETPHLIADSSTLVSIASQVAAERGLVPRVIDDEITGDVQSAAIALRSAADCLHEREVLIAAGETTVRVQGDGKGGRCSELAIRFALLTGDTSLPVFGLFAGSDGLDGNSGAAGVVLTRQADGAAAVTMQNSLARSDSASVVQLVGEAIMIPPTGNNLRDLYLIAPRQQ